LWPQRIPLARRADRRRSWKLPRAGVSKSTVSNVVRGMSGVSEATRGRVREAIDQLGYRPNILARQLVQQRTSILGVVVGDLANSFFAEMAKSVERHSAARGLYGMRGMRLILPFKLVRRFNASLGRRTWNPIAGDN
jgi:hypothetical protein